MTDKIIIYAPLCLNTRYPKLKCDKCRTSCPKQCIDENLQVDLASCDQCGLCVARCPVSAVFAVGCTDSDFQKVIAQAEDTIWFSCQKNDRHSNFPCLGFLDIRLLLVALFSKQEYVRQVILDNMECAKCRPAVAAALEQLLAQLPYFTQAQALAATAQHQFKRPEKVISRRELFKGLFHDVLEISTSTLHQLNGNAEALERQALFAEALQHLPTLEGFPIAAFKNIQVDAQTCNACGLCAQICPQHSIGAQVQADVLELYNNSLGCIECDICAKSCPKQAIAFVPSASLETICVGKIPLPRCEKCGKSYQPLNDSKICFECFLDDK